MATLKMAKTEADLREMRISDIKKSYIEIGTAYNKILNGEIIRCAKCGDFLKSDTSFYLDRKYANNRFPICKRCILAMVEQREKKTDKPNETKESVQRVLQMMDRIYDDEFYEDCIKGAKDNAGERNVVSPFSTYITSISSLPKWKGKTWADSNLGKTPTVLDDEEIEIKQETVKRGRKRFGNEFTDEELQLLETEYQDWTTRYECNTKAQEEVFENLSLNKLLKKRAIMNGKPTKDLDKQQQEWMDAGKLKPKQNNADTLSDAQTFGTMLQKWEENKPLPEIDPELQDFDKIGRYIDVFFKGHLAKMAGISNGYSEIYEKTMKEYTVEKPQYNEDEDSETLFAKLFGGGLDE